MNKGIIAIIIAVVAVLGLGSVLLLNSRSNNDKTASTSSTSSTEDSSDYHSNPSSSHNAAIQPPATSPSANPVASQGTEVEIEDFAFTPATLTVKKGTTVKWTNKDSVSHTVTGDESGGPDSALLAKGESYSFTFNTVGTFAYHCTPHPSMTAKVVVTE